MPLTPDQRRQLRTKCELIVPGFTQPSPAEEFRAIADWFDATGLRHDHYGEGELVQGFERKIAALLGKPAALFMPSGVMAQLTALRVWSEAARLDRFGIHPSSHLALHEAEAHAALLHAHAVTVGDRLRPMRAADLEAVVQPMACVMVELPIREAGGQLPSWDELEALKAAAQALGTRLHMDGARLWECAAHYGKGYAEIAAGFDSVYVSVYKGIGALSGALLAGDEAFIAQARLWRRRMGGTLYHLSPMVASAAMQFDARIALMPALHQRTLRLAEGLAQQASLRVNPAVPQVNMAHLFFDAPAERVADARDELAAQHGCWLVDNIVPAQVPGWSVSELYVGDRLLQIDDARVLPLFARLCAAMRASRP